MASTTNDAVHGGAVMQTSMFSTALEARCHLAMAIVLEEINPERSNDKAIWAWEKAHDAGFSACEDEAMPLMFQGHETLEDGFRRGQEWAYAKDRAEALGHLED